MSLYLNEKAHCNFINFRWNKIELMRMQLISTPPIDGTVAAFYSGYFTALCSKGELYGF